MQIKRTSSNFKYQILHAMATNADFLRRIHQNWEHAFFRTPAHSTIAGWIIHHWETAQNAPGRALIHFFESWRDEYVRDPGLVEDVWRVTTRILEDDRKINVPQMIEDAAQEFTRDRLEEIAEIIEDALADKRSLDEATQVSQGFQPVTLRDSEWYSLQNAHRVANIIMSGEPDSLLEFTPPFSRFFTNDFRSESLVAFQGPMKSGKSEFLVDIAVRAFQQRNRVLYFVLGDLSEREFLTRCYQRAFLQPVHAEEWPMEIRWPESISEEVDANGTPEIEWTTEIYEDSPTRDQVERDFHSLRTEITRSDDDFFLYDIHPQHSFSVKDLEAVITKLKSDNWHPDFVIVDYADNFRPLDAKKEHRYQVTQNWEEMSRIRADYSLCLVTATQANASALGRSKVSATQFSESVRKLAEVTALIGITSNEEDRRHGFCRLQHIVNRSGHYTPPLLVSGCWKLNYPTVVGAFEKTTE